MSVSPIPASHERRSGRGDTEMQRILFVDDDELILRSVGRLLRHHAEQAGWELSFTTDGDAALSLLEQQAFDVILIDAHMPRMSGTALLRRVQELHPGIVRILLSGHTDLDLLRTALPLAHQFIAKPYDSQRLKTTLENACGLRDILGRPELRTLVGSSNQLPSAPRTYVEISNALSNRLVHRWRSEEAAIMVGTNTALADDPALNVRHWKGKSPVRVVVDRKLRLPGHLKVFDQSVSTIILNSVKEEQDSKLIHVRVGDDNVHSMLAALQELKIQSVLVEGGAALLQSFINAGCWHEARVIINETLTVPQGVSAPQFKFARLVKTQSLGTDRIHHFIRQIS